MGDDECDSWEDLAEGEALKKKLDQLDLKAGAASAATAADDRLGDPQPTTVSPSVRILRRPDPLSARQQPEECGTKLNANSEPFIPRSQAPALQLEDSTRTQFRPKLMILKRETSGSGTKAGADGTQQRPSVGQTRTLEEREAEYRKARERIMGSASPTADTGLLPLPVGCQPAPATSFRSQAPPEVPLLRQPQPPSANGDRGFLRTKR